jgi:hypothetical protein
MLRLLFNGWFQCRLATDPDPSDEPRGVSGYMRALPGEPDFDRLIRWHPPVVQRSHTPTVGVFVRKVVRNGVRVADHPLVDAEVHLLGNPVFAGENGIVAEDGNEPIVPFELQVAKGQMALRRSCPDDPSFMEFPYPALQAVGVVISPGQIAEATGVFDIAATLTERIAALEEDRKKTTDATTLDATRRRIEFLKTPPASRFFGAMMPYFVPLAGRAEIKDPAGALGTSIDPERPWTVDFWMGGWDADAACGFVQGSLTVQEKTIQDERLKSVLPRATRSVPGLLSES